MFHTRIRYSVERNCCNPFICTKCGELGANEICCDESDERSLRSIRQLGPDPIHQPYAKEEN